MTGKQFLKAVSNGKEDTVRIFLDALASAKTDYCVIGGLAVNAYVEPVISLDVDIIVAAKNVETLLKTVEKCFKIEHFPHSVNLSTKKSDLRIQLQTDPRYEDFISRAEVRKVLGYKMKVASLEDVLQGKIWACLDKERRKSKRQKDLADIARLIEAYPRLKTRLPDEIRKSIEE